MSGVISLRNLVGDFPRRLYQHRQKSNSLTISDDDNLERIFTS